MSHQSNFSLVHVICEEFGTPLLNTQVYERAYHQTEIPAGRAPEKTYVFIIEALSIVLSKKYYKKTAGLRESFSPVRFWLIPFSSRLGSFLTVFALKCCRCLFIRGKVIFHCRGVAALEWVNKIKTRKDRIILDIRGYDPIEVFARSNKFDPNDLSDTEKTLYINFENTFAKMFKAADRIFTVSSPLALYLKTRFNLPDEINVIPCVVSSRNQSRDYLFEKQSDLINIVYLGGAQAYQGLQEMVIPFAKAFLEVSNDVRVNFVSQDKHIIQDYLKKNDLYSDRIVCISVQQAEVKEFMQHMDLGLLLRAPSLLNSFSQPVKLGEYLASGVGVIFEKGTGDLKGMLEEKGIGFEVNLWRKSYEEVRCEAARIIELFKGKRKIIKKQCTDFSVNEYSWKKYSTIENNIYRKLLKQD